MSSGVLDGLTEHEAAARLAADGPNELPTSRKRNLAQQAWDVMREPMLLLLVGAGVINFMLAELLDGILLMLAVGVVIGISIYQEHKTENALEALRNLSSPRALVIRDGAQRRIAGRDVVRGDIVLLVEGDRIPADGVLVEAINCMVQEATLTGESVPVRKTGVGDAAAVTELGRPGGDGTPFVFSGTLVVKGHAMALVARTGGDTELGRVGAALQTIETGRTRLQGEIDRIVRFIAVLGLGAAATVVIVYALTRGSWLEGMLAGIATAMAMLPEEFPVVLAVFLALGAWRMSQRRVLARRAPVIEALGSATVLCVDKTGTLTMNSMEVRDLIVDDDRWTLDDQPLPEAFHSLAEFAVLASPVDPFDPMDQAFRDLETRFLTGTEHTHADWQLVREYPLSDRLLALSHVWRSPEGDRYVIAAKGAPEAVAALCHFDEARLARLTEQVEHATADGQRVLAVARAYLDVASALPADQLDFGFEYLGLAGLHDPVRPGVPAAVAECRTAGIRTIMITGDYPGTALSIAREIGLDHSAGAMTGPELDLIDDATLAERIRTVNVFARMVPEQKLTLIRALRTDGEVVAMTGDGVNDAPALRSADIGIAMGARGTDVAREAADLVITDDDFTSIVGGVRQGRGVFDNLRKAMAFVISVHVPILGMSLIPLFAVDWPLVLLPLQIAMLELIIDPACSVVFEAEEIDPAIMKRPPREAGQSMLSRRVITIAALQGLFVLLGVLAVYLWAVASGRDSNEVRAVTFATLVFGNLALILINRSWRLTAWSTLRERHNATLKWILIGALTMLAVLLTVPAVRSAFGFGPLSLLDVGVAFVAASVSVIWFEVYKVVTSTRTAA